MAVDHLGRTIVDRELNEARADAERARKYREAVDRGEIEEDPRLKAFNERIAAKAATDARLLELSDAYDAKVEAEQARAQRERKSREEEEDKADPIRGEARRQLRLEAAKRELLGGPAATRTVMAGERAIVVDEAMIAAKRESMGL